MPEENNCSCKIRNFTEFLEESLGRKVKDFTIKQLTKPGDHYGSIMQAVDVKVVETNGCVKSKTLNLVSKTAVTNAYLIDIFQPSLTFVKEVHFYSDIIPALEYFEQLSNVPKNERIDIFIRCFGSRISLDSNAKLADADAVVLLENIKVLDFKNVDGFIGFDTAETLAVIKSLAMFHSLCIGMRREQFELFDAKISPFVEAINMIVDDDDTRMVDTICKELGFIDNLDSKLRAKIEQQLPVCFKFNRDTQRAIDTPFTTIVHRDLWINNIMIRKNDSAEFGNKGIEAKFYDFQLYFYQSFVHDLIFFLFTSVRPIVLASNFKLFINHYYNEFIKTLKLVDCPLDDYTFEKMWHEIQQKAKLELLHILFMSKLLLADKSTAPSMDEVSPETFYTDEPPSKIVLSRWKFIIDLFTQNQLI